MRCPLAARPRPASVSDCPSETTSHETQTEAASKNIAKLKDMVFVKDMRAAMTSGEFALRLRGAERPGLVDYEGLYNVLEGFAGRLSELEASEVLREEDAWKAEEDLKLIQGELQDRVVEMTQETGRDAQVGQDAVKSSSEQDTRRTSLNAKGQSPGLQSYERRLESALKNGQWQIASLLVQEVRELGLKVSAETYQLLCLQCATRASWQVALATFIALQPKLAVPEASPSASAVLGACLLGSGVIMDVNVRIRCNYLFTAAHGSWSKMLYILQALRHSVPSFLNGDDATIAMNITLRACAAAHAWEQALSMVLPLRKLQVQPSVATLGTVITACERSGQWRAAVEILSGKMARWGWQDVLPNVVCYNTAIAACRRTRHWKQALQLLRDGHLRSLRPDGVSVATTLRVVSSLKGHEWSGRAEELLLDMRRSRIHAADPVTLLGGAEAEGSTLLSRFSWMRALEILMSSVSGTCTAPPSSSVNSVLAVLRRHRRWAEALHVMTVLCHRPSCTDMLVDGVDVVGLVDFSSLLQDCLQTSRLYAVLPRLVRWTKSGNGISAPGACDAQAACLACDVLLGFGLLGTVQLSMDRRTARPLLRYLRSLISSVSIVDPAGSASRPHTDVHLARSDIAATAGLGMTRELVETLQDHKQAASQARKKFMLYLRGDQMVDVDTVLQDSQAEQPFSRDLWERLEGKTQHSEGEWSPYEDSQEAERRIQQKEAVLLEAKQELKTAKAKRAKVLKKMKKAASKGGLQDKKPIDLTTDLFRWDRRISGHQVLVLLANVDLIFDKVALQLEKLLVQADIAEWDHSGRRLKRLVLKLSALEVQVAPYRKYVRESPEKVVHIKGLDWDELQMLEEQIASIAQSVGLHVERINQRSGFFAPIRRQMLSFATSWQKIRRGIVFQANGVRLLSQDLRLALKLLLKVVFLNHALEDREVRICRRAVKDLLVLVPFLILLLIPLSPPGHMLVFSLILKVYPDFVPSPFTEHRQNVMRIYNAIKPVSEKSDHSSWS
ncbi:unnamed protein product [Symbiodinium sp. CCMP2592]|nr:unnamed protein product [Symbiodinium sp. CCMP2592]